MLFVIAIPVFSQNHLMAQKNMLQKDTTNYEIANCTALIVLSKDQCSACTNSMPDMVKKLGKLGFQSSFAIVMDRTLMECKNDEMYLRSVLDEPSIYFLEDKNVQFKSFNDSVFQSVYLETTPALILFSALTTEVIHSPFIMDDYGRAKNLSFINPCMESKKKNILFKMGED